MGEIDCRGYGTSLPSLDYSGRRSASGTEFANGLVALRCRLFEATRFGVSSRRDRQPGPRPGHRAQLLGMVGAEPRPIPHRGVPADRRHQAERLRRVFCRLDLAPSHGAPRRLRPGPRTALPSIAGPCYAPRSVRSAITRSGDARADGSPSRRLTKAYEKDVARLQVETANDAPQAAPAGRLLAAAGARARLQAGWMNIRSPEPTRSAR